MMRSLCAVFISSAMLWAAAPDATDSAEAVKALAKILAEKPKDWNELAKANISATALTKADAEKAKKFLWDAWVAKLKAERADEWKDALLKQDKLELKFSTKTFGKAPKAGHSFWISLHGGGGAPKEVNEQQWENQKKLYKLDEGIYFVPRAPTNTWNLWHESHIDSLFERAIQNAIALDGVDPDRVYVMGYSAGGDGVYQIGPRMADRWAAAAMMAGHPNDASPLSLRNTAFSIQMGEKDSAYNRNKVAEEWKTKLVDLQKDDPDGYVHDVKIHAGKGHWMGGDDAAILPWMAKKVRNPIPEKIVWKQGGTPHRQFYWLAVANEKASTLTVVTRKKQTVTIDKSEGLKELTIRLDDRMLDLDDDVTISAGGKEKFKGTSKRTIGTLLKTLQEQGDPKLMFSAEVAVDW